MFLVCLDILREDGNSDYIDRKGGPLESNFLLVLIFIYIIAGNLLFVFALKCLLQLSGLVQLGFEFKASSPWL